MNFDVAARLLALNQEFYTRFAESFSATRQRLQPGVMRVLDSLHGDESILDLGCGNGALARELDRRGHQAPYLGLDFSPALLREADSLPLHFPAEFREADLTRLTLPKERIWSCIIAFAVLHHIPSQALQLNFLQSVRELLALNGRFIASNWQFLNSDKLKKRIQPWSAISLSDADVDAGDYLLDWRSDGPGLRYVHHFSAEELTGLAEQAGLRTTDSFTSDGEGGRLSLYQEFVRA